MTSLRLPSNTRYPPFVLLQESWAEPTKVANAILVVRKSGWSRILVLNVFETSRKILFINILLVY